MSDYNYNSIVILSLSYSDPIVILLLLSLAVMMTVARCFAFHYRTDQNFLPSSSKNLSKVLFHSSRSVHQSALPERALLHRDQIPNTPVTLSPPKKYETRHRKDDLTRISGDAAFNRDDIAGCRASNDDRLPVVELHPFTRKEWRPSNSIPVLSSSSSNSSTSSASLVSSNILVTRTMTSSEIAVSIGIYLGLSMLTNLSIFLKLVNLVNLY